MRLHRQSAKKSGREGSPPTTGGNLSYSRAARETPEALKEKIFADYGLTDPHDKGHSYEVDHRVPLSLGGRDLEENLWPETRTAPKWSAWVKDRLEFKLWNMVCHPKAGTAPLALTEAQAVFTGDWIAEYPKYCPAEQACPAYAE